MRKTIELMREKMEMLQYGLLRFREGKGHQMVEVNTDVCDELRLNCIINDEGMRNELPDRDVVLIQKNGQDYFYINGRIDDHVKTISTVLSLTITKASWFIRKRKGTVMWLEQKYVYESVQKKIENNCRSATRLA